MKLSTEVRSDVVIPDKGAFGAVSHNSKYPFGALEEGEVVEVEVEESDESGIVGVKKKLVNAARAYMSKLGKTMDGEIRKEIAVFTDAKRPGIVFIGCRVDRTALPTMADIAKIDADAAAKAAIEAPAAAAAKKGGKPKK
jgi:hypothetical protein